MEKNTEILINAGLYETRVALLENSILQEVYIERKSSKGIVGNIYKGHVERVLPGMDAAFINIGLEKNAFLHVKNIVGAVSEGEDKTSILDHVHQGQNILVQVIKDPMGNKGARLSTEISIPSRYVVFLPNSKDIGISTRIEDEALRHHLKDCIAKFSSGLSGGYIVRTAIENTDDWAMHGDIQYLQKIWAQIQDKGKAAKAATLLYQGLSLPLRVLRDCVDKTVTSIRVDNATLANEMEQFVSDFFPENQGLVKYYESTRPIFDLCSTDDEIEKALKRTVKLKSGGHIVIDQTEAMTTIDVNTGKFVGSRNHEETIFKTNLEATRAIARQLRLRNLGGIIIIDFIDMQDDYHKNAVVNSLREAMDSGYSRYTIESFSALGLLTMTRKRVRESLGHILCEPCPACSGRGYIKTLETLVFEVIREMQREVAQFRPQGVILIASYEMGQYLEESPDLLADISETLKVPVKIQVDNYYSREHYDIALM